MTATDPPAPPRTGRPPLSWVVAGLVVAVGLVATVVRSGPMPLAPVPTPLASLPDGVAGAIAGYRGPRVWASIGLRVVAVVVPVAVVATRPGRALLDRLAGPPRPGAWRPALRGAVVGAVVTALVDVVGLPLVAWAGIVQDGAWQVRTASAGAWWARVGVSIVLEVGTVAVLGAALVLLVRWRPRTWPADLVLGGVVATAAVTALWPVAVLPLTTPVRPLGDSPAEQAVRRTLDEVGLAALDVVVAVRSDRDVRANAVVHGLGPTRRVVVDDTLLDRPVAQVEAVLAHEAGHQAARDVERAVLGSAALVAVGALAVRLAWRHPRVRARLAPPGGGRCEHDPRLVALALAVVAVATPVLEPVGLWRSRQVEATADAYALANGADPATTVALQRRLAIDNLSPLAPPAWQVALWSSHPSGADRIGAAVARAMADGLPLPDLEDLARAEAADPPRWSRPSG